MKQADTGFAAHASTEKHIEVISLDSFIPSSIEPGASAADMQRKFSTFLLASKENSSAFCAALNASEERYALKSPLFLKRNAPGSSLEDSPSADRACIEKAQRQLLLDEYRNTLAVSNIKGFPKVYGLGQADNCPIMVTEYIEGITLANALSLLPHNGKGQGIAPYVAATIIQTATAILLNARCLDGTFVHRDLSPRNIIIRTEKDSLDAQLKKAIYDLRLVDMGSAVYRTAESPYQTTDHGIWRFGTAEYAAPEMLTRDVEGIEAKRYSETIDTYALCSILYMMIAGKTPYGLAARIDKSPYLVKTKEAPAACEVAPECAELLRLATEGITARQNDRYDLAGLYEALDAWRHTYAQENGLESCPPPEQFCLAN